MNLELAAALAPWPASCITPSLHQEELIDAMPPLPATALTFNHELVFDNDDFAMQFNPEPYDDIPTCCTTEEQYLLAAEPNYLCADDFWGSSNTMLHERDGDDGGAVSDMQSTLAIWENLFSKATSLLNNGTSPSASQSISPDFLSCESPTTFLADTDTSNIGPSQVHSDASSFATYKLNPHNFYTNNPVDEQFDINFGRQISPVSYKHMSFSQGFAFGDAPVTYSGSAASIASTSDDDFIDSGASSLAAILSPPSHALNFPRAGASPLPLNLEARASRLQLNEARASPLQQSASYHDISATGAMRNTSNRRARQSGEAVSILLENSTPAIDDGHVWRKYGQKDIKDKIHPRSYYRCAQPACPIKKQIELSSDKQGFVLITYIGKHNH